MSQQMNDWYELEGEDHELCMKRIKTSTEIDDHQGKFSYPTISNKSTRDKACPKEELARRCKHMIECDEPRINKYLNLILKNLENGRISLH